MHRAVKIPNVTITLRFCVPGNQEFSLLNTHQVRSDKSLNRKPFMTAAARFFTGCMPFPMPKQQCQSTKGLFIF